MRRMLAASNLALLILLSMGCAGSRQPPAPPSNANRGDKDMSGMKLTSTAFKEGEPIPRAYTCDGPNVSPALEWSGVPKSAKTMARARLKFIWSAVTSGHRRRTSARLIPGSVLHYLLKGVLSPQQGFRSPQPRNNRQGTLCF